MGHRISCPIVASEFKKMQENRSGIHNQLGGTLIEFALVCALVATVGIVAVSNVGSAISDKLNVISVELEARGTDELYLPPLQEPSARFWTDESKSATVTYTWSELMKGAEAEKYGYNRWSVTWTSLSGYTFDGCSLLQSIVLPDTIEKITRNCFYRCTSLESIVIPESAVNVECEILYKCPSLRYLEVKAPWTYVPYQICAGCTSLETVILPDTITSISKFAFSGCSSLSNINWPKSLSTIGQYSFQYCSSLSTIQIPYGTEIIERNAFSNCKALREVVIPDTVREIYDYAFGECSSLEEITIPDSVTYLNGQGTFIYCTSLRMARLSENIEAIGGDFFFGCPSLTSIYVPAKVRTIRNNAFHNCASLSELRFGGTSEQWKSIDFGTYWGANSPFKEIICSDGTVRK